MIKFFSNSGTRRNNTLNIFLMLIFGSLLCKPAFAQEDFNVIKNNWLKYSDAENALYHHLTEQAYEMLEKRKERIQKLNTPRQWRQRQQEIRETMWDVLGPFNDKTPLNVRITDTIYKNGYRVENIIYESLPDFYVTASLFIPDELNQPGPAILFCSGHSQRAYRRPYYQLPLLNLVKKGFVVLAIDPIGQGERMQYFNDVTGASMIGSSTKEHSYPATQVSLLGKSVARYFLWDGIRGIDYLVSRPEVDRKRIGVHGLSGGGTQTAYISALDERVVASAIAGYITSYRRLLESIGVQDGEQNFYHGIARGIDHGDFLEVRAPKPTLMMATTRDFFSIQGARETYEEAKRVFDIFGKPGNLQKVEDDHGHGYTQKTREAMYAFFQKNLNNPGNPTEEEVTYLSDQELRKTTTGQVATSLGGETVFSLNRKEAEKRIEALDVSRNNLKGHLSESTKSAKNLSGYKAPQQVGTPVFTGRYQRDNYVIEKYFVRGEGDYVIPYLLFVPDDSNQKGLIYLHPSGKAAESGKEGEIAWFVEKGYTLLAPDLIGTGEMGPGNFRGDAYFDGISFNMWFTAMQTGRSITGIRAGDLGRLAILLNNRKEINTVYGLARKEMAPVLLHGAAFNQDITRIALVEPYVSYRSIVMNRFYNRVFVPGLVPGALKGYDLPDLAASLAPKKLLMANVTNGMGHVAGPNQISKDLDIIIESFQAKQAMDQLNITYGVGSGKEHTYALYEKWLE